MPEVPELRGRVRPEDEFQVSQGLQGELKISLGYLNGPVFKKTQAAQLLSSSIRLVYQALFTHSERKPVESADSVRPQSSWDPVPGRAPSSLQPPG